jgi:hypothetical protein
MDQDGPQPLYRSNGVQVGSEKLQEPARSHHVRSQGFCTLTQAAVRGDQCDLIGCTGCIGGDLDDLVIAATGSMHDRHPTGGAGFDAVASLTFQNHDNGRREATRLGGATYLIHE